MNSKINKTLHSGSTISNSSSCSFSVMGRRSKTDWAGIGIGDAFKQNLDFSLRMPAQRLFYTACRKIQIAAMRMAGLSVEGTDPFKAKPQLAPCYTTYPATLAAYAAIGLTGFLEFNAAASLKLLSTHYGDYLENPAFYDHVSADPDIYKRLVAEVAGIVQNRLILEDLSRSPEMSAIEIYRLFSASQQNFRFESLPEILNAVILYGDVLPDWKHQSLHPLTRDILADLDLVCPPYFNRLSTENPAFFLAIGHEWIADISIHLAKYLPVESDEEKQSNPWPLTEKPECEEKKSKGSRKFGRKSSQANSSIFSPLDGPNPPALFDTSNAVDQTASSLLSGLAENPPADGSSVESKQTQTAMEAIMRFKAALDQAGAQKAQWEDMRSDRVERALVAGAFSESPIQGNQTDGHAVQVLLNGCNACNGEVFDRPVELSNDVTACNRLLRESQPIAEALKRNLYPNVEEAVETERMCSTGSLDPARLAMMDYSDVLFRRYRIKDKDDRRGAPVLLIACDGSGSLNSKQIGMLKVLTAAWLNSTTKSRVQIMAGLYHSGTVRDGISGPLVQWIFHPRKTPAIGHKDAARALVTLPDSGTGVQSDALSLTFMLNEAGQLAKGRSIYMILISDCAWNRSFRTEMSGKEEVCSFFQTAKEDYADRLHTTLVALGTHDETGLEQLVDSIIPVPDAQLDDYSAIAEKIGVYVASCMRKRRG